MQSYVTLYGLANCDTSRAARKWLDGYGVGHVFHDVRADGLALAAVEGWVKQLGSEKVLNRASTTWRELPAEAKASVNDQAAVKLLMAHPTLVKRPVLDRGGSLTLGFKPAAYAELFK